VVGCRSGPRRVDDALSQEVQDASDALGIQLLDGGDGVLEFVARDEARYDPLGDRAMGDDAFDLGFVSNPKQ
jgi:hypothetical protein